MKFLPSRFCFIYSVFSHHTLKLCHIERYIGLLGKLRLAYFPVEWRNLHFVQTILTLPKFLRLNILKKKDWFGFTSSEVSVCSHLVPSLFVLQVRQFFMVEGCCSLHHNQETESQKETGEYMTHHSRTHA